MTNFTKQWHDASTKFLVGKTIKFVRYMTEEEADDMGWHSKPLVIFFTDGSHLFSSADDEGNDGGALFTSDEDLPCIPVMRF
jgi:hypothetical protein